MERRNVGFHYFVVVQFRSYNGLFNQMSRWIGKHSKPVSESVKTLTRKNQLEAKQ